MAGGSLGLNEIGLRRETFAVFYFFTIAVFVFWSFLVVSTYGVRPPINLDAT